MGFLYHISILLLGCTIRVASLFSPKAKRWLEGRKNWQETLDSIPKSDKICWFHCASLGEFDQGLDLMFALKEREPSCLIVVSFFSPSGMDHYKKRKNCVDYAVYLPLDTPKNAALFIQKLQPTYAIFIKYEFWANVILAAKKQGVVLLSVATLLRKDQVYFKFYGGFFRQLLQSFDYFFVQNKSTFDLLQSIEIEQVVCVGDTRFDRVLANRASTIEKSNHSSLENEIFSSFLEGEKAIIFGSSWREEEGLLLALLESGCKRKIIVAPHDVKEENSVRLMDSMGDKAIRFTAFNDYRQQQVLILDTIGHLSMAYRFGDIAVIGGGFSGKLHNILEPLVFGLPVIFGPKVSKFPETEQPLLEGFAFKVASTSEFLEVLNAIQENTANLSLSASLYIEQNCGATKSISTHSIFTF
jgi:3-deoxy-D-manno-octulosonic-acid transferase